MATPRPGAPCPRCSQLPGGEYARLFRGLIKRLGGMVRGIYQGGIIWHRQEAA